MGQNSPSNRTCTRTRWPVINPRSDVHIKNTKIRIRLGQIVIEMDFSDNFTALGFFKNIQGVHWAKNLVTIHTVVVYYLIEEVEGVQHKSFVYLSPVDQHNTIMVWAILKLLWQRDLPRFFKDQKIDFVHVQAPSTRTGSSSG